MSSIEKSAQSLDNVRQQIDELDDQIVDLIAKRFSVTAHVRGLKQQDLSVWPSPIRPTREANIVRRLLARTKNSSVNPDLVVRVWRTILNESSRNQAPITLHVSKHLNTSIAHRLRLRDYFGPMPVEEYKDEAQALLQIESMPGDLCVVETAQPWVEAFASGIGGKAQVIGCLPTLKEDVMPKLLILGQAPVEPTGQDETLVITEGNLPRDFSPQPMWQVKVGGQRLSCLPGFLLEHEGPLVGLTRSNASLSLKVAGRYASAIEGLS
jgi:chorismate mutase